jgi:hypothetical protein
MKHEDGNEVQFMLKKLSYDVHHDKVLYKSGGNLSQETSKKSNR